MIWPARLPAVLHASTIASDGRALVICGPSGSGKSALALQLMALGAGLISDDLTELRLDRGTIVAARPAAASGPAGIEARGVGLLAARTEPPAAVAVALDLGQVEKARLPEPRRAAIAGVEIPLLHKVENAAFPAMLWQYLRYGPMEGAS